MGEIEKEDQREWLTVFPDWPYAFAWIRNPCRAEDLDSFVGGCGGDAYPDKKRACIEEVWLDDALAETVCTWMEHWRSVEEKLMDHAGEDWEPFRDEQDEVDREGIEIARLIKATLGDRYRVRYSYAWKHNPGDWVIV